MRGDTTGYPVVKESMFDPGYRIKFSCPGTGTVISGGNTVPIGAASYVSQFWAEMFFREVKETPDGDAEDA